MGTDTNGKQEVEPALLARATVFTDEVAQSVSIGEAQHAIAAGLITAADITPIGAVINGLAEVAGRPTRSRCSTAPVSGFRISPSPGRRSPGRSRAGWRSRSGSDPAGASAGSGKQGRFRRGENTSA